LKLPGVLRDGHREQGLALLAEFGRSATWRSRSKFMLAPQAMATRGLAAGAGARST
jgi:hypothetical protein